MVELAMPTHTVSIEYDLAGRMEQADALISGSTINLINNIHDDRGLRIMAQQSGGVPRLYAYDLAGRMLTEINITDGDENENPVIEFIYLGNRRIAIMTGNADSPCFIATAAATTGAGVPSGIASIWINLAPLTEADLDTLRAFRDRGLKRFNAGRKFVKWYYREGPKGAAWLNPLFFRKRKARQKKPDGTFGAFFADRPFGLLISATTK